MRWRIYLQSFDFLIRYNIKGSQNVVPDALSRLLLLHSVWDIDFDEILTEPQDVCDDANQYLHAIFVVEDIEDQLAEGKVKPPAITEFRPQ